MREVQALSPRRSISRFCQARIFRHRRTTSAAGRVWLTFDTPALAPAKRNGDQRICAFIGEELAIQKLGVRFTVRGIMLVVACVVLILGMFKASLEWPRNPHIDVTILNESSTAISDLRVSFLYGERTAGQLRSGGVAFTEIQSGGNAGIFVSYRDSTCIHIVGADTQPQDDVEMRKA
jgi:hypothetical protein